MLLFTVAQMILNVQPKTQCLVWFLNFDFFLPTNCRLSKTSFLRLISRKKAYFTSPTVQIDNKFWINQSMITSEINGGFCPVVYHCFPQCDNLINITAFLFNMKILWTITTIRFIPFQSDFNTEMKRDKLFGLLSRMMSIVFNWNKTNKNWLSLADDFW